MDVFLDEVDRGLDVLAKANPEGLVNALTVFDALLAQDPETMDARRFRSQLARAFLRYPSTRQRFYDFVPDPGVRQGVDEPEDVAIPLAEQFARLRLIRNKRIVKDDVTIDDEVIAYLHNPDADSLQSPSSEDVQK